MDVLGYPWFMVIPAFLLGYPQVLYGIYLVIYGRTSK